MDFKGLGVLNRDKACVKIVVFMSEAGLVWVWETVHVVD